MVVARATSQHEAAIALERRFGADTFRPSILALQRPMPAIWLAHEARALNSPNISENNVAIA